MKRGSAKKRPRRALRVLLAIALLVVGGVAIIGLTGMPILDRWARARLTSELEKVLGRPVTIESVKLRPWARSLRIRGIAVRETPPGERLVLEIPSVTARLRLAPLLDRRLEIASMRVDRPRAHFFVAADRVEGPLPVKRAANGAPRPASGWAAPKLVLRGLEIVDGSVAFENTAVPVSLWAEELIATWEGDEHGDGRGTLDAARAGGDLRGFTELGKIHAEARIVRGEAAAEVHVEWGRGSRLASQATIDLRAGPGKRAPTGEIRGTFTVVPDDVPRWGSALIGDKLPLAGALEGSFLVHLAAEGWSAEASFTGSNLRMERFAAPILRANLRMQGGAVELQHYEIEGFGGRVEGSGRIEPRTGGAIALSARGEGLSLNGVLRALGLTSTLEASAAIDGSLVMTIGDPASLRVSALLRGAGSDPMPAGAAGEREGRRRFPISGTARLEIVGRRLVLASEQLETASIHASKFRIEKELGARELVMDMGGDIGALADASDLVGSFLSGGSASFPWRADQIDGTGTLEGRLTFIKNEPLRGQLAFALGNFAYEGVGASVVRGTAAADGRTFTVEVTEASKGDSGTLRLTGTFPEGRRGPSVVSAWLDRWSLTDLLARLGAPEGASLRASGPVSYRFGEGRPSGEAELVLTSVEIGDERFDEGRFSAVLRGSSLQITRLDLAGEHARMTGTGVYDLDMRRLSGELEGTHVDTAIARPWLKGLPVQGHATVHLRAASGDQGWEWSASMIPEEDLAFKERPLEAFALSAEGTEREARFEGALGAWARFSGRIALEGEREGQGTIELTEVPVQTLVGVVRPDIAPSVYGEVSGTISWSGPLDTIERLDARADLSPVRIVLGGETFESEGPVRLGLENGRVVISDVELHSNGSRVRISGSYPVEEQGTLDLEVGGDIDLAALSAFVPDLRASGALHADLRAVGRMDALDLSGTVSLSGGRVRLLTFPLAADRLAIDGRVGEGAIVLDSISGWLGGGELRGKGRIPLRGLAPSGIEIEGRVRNVVLPFPDGFMGEYSGTVAWRQTPGEPGILSGDLTLVRGIYRKDFNLDRISFGERRRAPIITVPQPDEGIKRTRLDFAIHADDNVWCRNDLADVEGSAQVRVGGTIGSPSVTGSFEAFQGGEMRFRGIRYTVERAVVTFPPGPTVRIEYDVEAETRVHDYDVRLHLRGNPDSVEYQLSSTPALSEKQILSLLLTGADPSQEGIAQIAPDGLGSSSSAVEGAIASIAGSGLERFLNLQEVRIEPVPSEISGTQNTARVTVGKRLSPRIFVRTAVAINAPEDPIYQVEYMLNRHLQLLLERGEFSSIGGDLKYSTRFYGLGARKDTATEEAAPPRRASSRRIGSIQFVGDPAADQEALRRISRLDEGKEFTRSAMVAAADRIKADYVKRSYLEATVFPAMTPNGDRADIAFTIEKGPKIDIAILGSGFSRRKVHRALKALWRESRLGGNLVAEAEETIRRILHEEGNYASLVRSIVVEDVDYRRVTFVVEPGEKVYPERVEIRGARQISESDIREQVLTGSASVLTREPLKPDVLQADEVAIENLYRTRGFLRAQVSSEVSLSAEGDRAFVAFIIDEGRPSHLASVHITGNQSISEAELRTLVKSKEGGTFLPLEAEGDREAIRAYYDERGYPDIKVDSRAIADGERIDLTFEVSEGGHKTVDTIEIEGNVVTDTAVVRRQVALREGETLTQTKIQETRQKLLRTGLYSHADVSYVDAPGRGSGQIVKIQIRDQPNLIVRLGGGYDTENGVRGTVTLGDSNLFGRGRYADISATYGSRIKRAQTTYREPNPFGWLTNASISFFYEDWVRETFTQFQEGGYVVLEKKTGAAIAHYVSYTNRYTRVSDLEVDEQTFREANPRIDLDPIRLADVGYGFVRSTREPSFSPKTGTFVNVQLRVFDPSVGSEKQFAKMFLQGSYYKVLPLGINWATSARMGYGWRGEDEPIPLQERYFAGGDATVRGFPQDGLGYVELDEDGIDVGTLEHDTLIPLGGEAMLIVNNEFRHKIVGGLSGAIFLDIGNIYPRPDDVFRVEPRFTAGAGLRFDTPVGPVRLEYGHKLDRQEGESAGEIFLSLGQAF